MRVTAEGSPRHWAERILQELRPVFDPKKPTALFVGRYQPFHDGHRRLIEEGIRRVGQACVAVRDTQGTNEKKPFSFFDVKQRIEAGLSAFAGRYVTVPLPNITHIFYGRDVGYAVERIYLDDAIEAVSATKIRDEAEA
ncbi:adenylyltransferase/cytidyltransferase family protein [Rhodomicrobium sp.]|uniref:adenylyltransferase/cytidyltransferase family protein n=1 Tax=Rhodomicrobium sp. TaxID=2720632 RepID=UPI0039E3369D